MSGSGVDVFYTGNGTFKAVNPIVSRVGDFTPFYIAIAISSVLLGCMIILNIVCCCSRHSDYWLNRHTGNRWLVSIWSVTPHKQPPLDYSDLKNQEELGIHVYTLDQHHDIMQAQKDQPSSTFQQPLTSSQEYLELIRRESDI